MYEELFSQEELDFIYCNASYFHISTVRQPKRLHILCSSTDYDPITVSEISHILESNNIYTEERENYGSTAYIEEQTFSS